MKELLSLLKSEKKQTVEAATKKFKSVFEMISTSNKILESSTSMMSFQVDDLLDFAQLNAGKFRKVIKKFDLKEAVEEVVEIQADKAKMAKIKLHSIFKVQSNNEEEIVSLFNKTQEKSSKKKKENESDSDDDFLNYDFAQNDNDASLKNFQPETKIMIETDKRRLQ